MQDNFFWDDGYSDDSKSIVTYVINGKSYSEKEYAELIREKYVKHPPVGYSSREIKNMSDNDILDMDYFLNE